MENNEMKDLIQSKYDELKSSNKVANWLNDGGYTAPSGGKWWQKTVDRFLDKLVYRKPTESVRKEKVKEEPKLPDTKISSKGNILVRLYGDKYM